MQKKVIIVHLFENASVSMEVVGMLNKHFSFCNSFKLVFESINDNKGD